MTRPGQLVDGPGRPWPAVVGAALLLLAATPPIWFPGAALLILPGLLLQYLVATGRRWRLRGSYLLGVLHLGAFSWSLHHVAGFIWLFVALVGGLYYLLVAVALRPVPRRWQPLAFGVAVAGACWARAMMPEIAYPHGQPCHGFWRWPWALGAVRVGGEPLANALLAWLAASLVVAGAAGERRRLGVSRGGIAAAVAWLVVALVGAPTPRSDAPGAVEVVAVEPGQHPADLTAGARDRAEYERLRRAMIEERLLPATLQAAAKGVADPPDLVLWPESSVHAFAHLDAAGAPSFRWLERAFELAPTTQLVVGTDLVVDPTPGRELLTPVAAQVDARGYLLGIQEKQYPVPGGERIPFLALLPGFLAAPLADALRATFGGYLPNVVAGAARPPLRTAAGVPFATLVCFDNAFPAPFEQAAAAGARFVAVISNESWYRGGAEVWQLAAMTVMHAIAVEMPVVRCTTDGLSLAVDRDGAILAELPHAPAPTPAARILRVRLPLGEGTLPPLARPHPMFGPTTGLLLLVGVLLAIVQRVLPWARLGGPDRSSAARAGGGPRPEAKEGGS